MAPVGEPVTIPSGEEALGGYLAIGEGIERTPGIVIIHEISGLDEHTREVAERFAASGYTGLAVDLFSLGTKPGCLMRIFYGILFKPLDNGTVAHLRAALDFLASQPKVDASRLGVIGFCMGGSYALQLACVEGRLRAASVFYGQNPRPLEAVARACPIVGSYPERDFTAPQARKLDAALEKHRVAHDIKIYSGARHSFFNSGRRAHDPAATQDSWRRTLAFFDVHLGHR